MTTARPSWSKLLDNPPIFIPLEKLPTYEDAIRTTEEAIETHKNDYIIGFDLETTGFYYWRDEIRVVQFYGYPSNKLSILHYPAGTMPESLIDFINSKPDTIWAGQNVITFDSRFLAAYGVDVLNMHMWDTLLVEGIINSAYRKPQEARRNDLQSLVARYNNIHIPKDVDHSSWQDGLFTELTTQQLKYAADDVRFLTNMVNKQVQELKEPHTKKTSIFELNVAKPVLQMSLKGIPVDRERFLEFQQENNTNIKSAKAKMRTYFEGNPDSSTQILKHMQEEGYDITATNAQVLRDYKKKMGLEEDPLIDDLLTYRKYSKLNKMYDTKWLQTYLTKTGTIASNYTQTATGTYRTSSRNPNAQNYPLNIRQIFGHPTEYMVVCDYSTVEMRIAAVLTQDPVMLNAFINGLDIHRITAASLFNKAETNVVNDERQAAKAANFAMIFGGGPDAIIRKAEQMELSPINEVEAASMRNAFFQRYTKMADVHRVLNLNMLRQVAIPDHCLADKELLTYLSQFYDTSKGVKYDDNNTINQLTIKIGYNPGSPETFLGHTRTLYDSDVKITTALNTPIQGTAAIGMKAALLYLYLYYPEVVPYLAGTVHDEILLVGYKDKMLAEEHTIKLQDAMLKGMEQVCPGVKYEAEGKIVHYWDEAK